MITSAYSSGRAVGLFRTNTSPRNPLPFLSCAAAGHEERPQTPVDVQKIRRLGCPVLARGESATHGPCDCFLYDRMAQRPAVLENLIFVFLGVLDVESGLKPSERGLPSDCFFNFLQDFQAILYHKLYCLLREIIHLLSADPEEGLPAEFVEPHQPRLFSSEEFAPVSLLLSQKLIQRKGGAAGVAKIPARLAIGCWF